MVESAVAELGQDLTCDLFFRTEREYWMRRNAAARAQKARQDRLGLGWANHDHHAYRSSRSCFTDLVDVLEGQGDATDLVEQAGELDASLIAIEEELIQLRSTGTGQDGVRYPAKIAEKLSRLFNGIGTADFRPTNQHGEVHILLRDALMSVRADLDEVLDN